MNFITTRNQHPKFPRLNLEINCSTIVVWATLALLIRPFKNGMDFVFALCGKYFSPLTISAFYYIFSFPKDFHQYLTCHSMKTHAYHLK